MFSSRYPLYLSPSPSPPRPLSLLLHPHDGAGGSNSSPRRNPDRSRGYTVLSGGSLLGSVFVCSAVACQCVKATWDTEESLVHTEPPPLTHTHTHVYPYLPIQIYPIHTGSYICDLLPLVSAIMLSQGHCGAQVQPLGFGKHRVCRGNVLDRCSHRLEKCHLNPKMGRRE